ncbi:MAG TPA: GHMP kinase [Phycisphaerae bacterium]|nr:GHMP kinase [Phycisphaerae bacterium]
MNEPNLLGMEIHSAAPVRMSFAGGGTDVTPFPERYGGMVVNATISTYMRAHLRLRTDDVVVIRANTRPEPIVYPHLSRMRFDGRLDFIKAIAKAMYRRREGFELTLESAVRMRSGLGGSGAMCVAVQGAFNHLRRAGRLSIRELAELAYTTETMVLRNASGRQDQYAAAFGGINHMAFDGDRVTLTPVDVAPEGLRRLADGLLLLDLGERSAASGGIIEEQTRGVEAGGDVLKAMRETVACVVEMCDAIRHADLPRVGELLDVLWTRKKRFCSRISNSRIDRIYEAMRAAGMVGGKVTGAGGGGHMMACCDPARRKDVAAAARDMGAVVVPFKFVFHGLRTWHTPAAASAGAYVPHGRAVSAIEPPASAAGAE